MTKDSFGKNILQQYNDAKHKRDTNVATPQDEAVISLWEMNMQQLAEIEDLKGSLAKAKHVVEKQRLQAAEDSHTLDILQTRLAGFIPGPHRFVTQPTMH